MWPNATLTGSNSPHIHPLGPVIILPHPVDKITPLSVTGSQAQCRGTRP